VQSTEHAATATPRVLAWTPQQFAARVDEAMAIYAQAMSYPPHAATQRAVTARRHTAHEGFACRAAVLDDGTLVGFGYGYTTLPGQWWHDLVRRALDDEQSRTWLADAFELSELHVLPEFQGSGTGRVVLGELAASLPHETMLLSTPDIDTRAFRLYRHLGFVDLRRHYLFPGDVRPFAVLGARLPLRTDGR
jgi:ribosomal protein S18 acetylase RimI-like enzyme